MVHVTWFGIIGTNIPVFYKKYFSFGILTANDLHISLNNIKYFELFRKNIGRSNTLEWIGLRHFVPIDLRNPVFHRHSNSFNPSFKVGSGDGKNSRGYYFLLALKKARLPNYAQTLKERINR